MMNLGVSGVQSTQNDVVRVVQPLVAGINVIVHNLGFSPVQVQVWNNSTGSAISVRVVAESTSSVTISVPVAVAMARINIDA